MTPEGLGLAIELVSELVTRVPCAELHSRGDGRLLGLLHVRLMNMYRQIHNHIKDSHER